MKAAVEAALEQKMRDLAVRQLARELEHAYDPNVRQAAFKLCEMANSEVRGTQTLTLYPTAAALAPHQGGVMLSQEAKLPY